MDTTATLSYTTLVGPTPIAGLGLNLPAASTAYNTAAILAAGSDLSHRRNRLSAILVRR